MIKMIDPSNLIKGTLEYHQYRYNLYIKKNLPSMAQSELNHINGIKRKTCKVLRSSQLEEMIRLQHLRIASMIKAYTDYNDSTCDVSIHLRKALDGAYNRLAKLEEELEESI